jgi:arginase
MKNIIGKFKDKPIHISFDVDAIDPEHAHGTGTLVDGGLTSRESHYMLRKLAATN